MGRSVSREADLRRGVLWPKEGTPGLSTRSDDAGWAVSSRPRRFYNHSRALHRDRNVLFGRNAGSFTTYCLRHQKLTRFDLSHHGRDAICDERGGWLAAVQNFARCAQPESGRAHRPTSRPTCSLGGRTPPKTGGRSGYAPPCQFGSTTPRARARGKRNFISDGPAAQRGGRKRTRSARTALSVPFYFFSRFAGPFFSMRVIKTFALLPFLAGHYSLRATAVTAQRRFMNSYARHLDLHLHQCTTVLPRLLCLYDGRLQVLVEGSCSVMQGGGSGRAFPRPCRR